MGRHSIQEHEKLDLISPLRVRANVAHREVWREHASELGMTETAFARTAVLMTINYIFEQRPDVLIRAVKRANRALTEIGYPIITEEEILQGFGLPEQGMFSLSNDTENTASQKLSLIVNGDDHGKTKSATRNPAPEHDHQRPAG